MYNTIYVYHAKHAKNGTHPRNDATCKILTVVHVEIRLPKKNKQKKQESNMLKSNKTIAYIYSIYIHVLFSSYKGWLGLLGSL